MTCCSKLTYVFNFHSLHSPWLSIFKAQFIVSVGLEKCYDKMLLWQLITLYGSIYLVLQVLTLPKDESSSALQSALRKSKLSNTVSTIKLSIEECFGWYFLGCWWHKASYISMHIGTHSIQRMTVFSKASLTKYREVLLLITDLFS